MKKIKSKTKKEENSSKKDSPATAIETPKENRTDLLNIKNDEMIAAITQTRKKKSTFNPKDIIPEEEPEKEPEEKEEPEESLEEIVE